MRLPPKIKLIILYAIAMADYDQGVCPDLLKTKDGTDRLALYQSSVGRFTNAAGALIYSIYGQGVLPQAFMIVGVTKEFDWLLVKAYFARSCFWIHPSHLPHRQPLHQIFCMKALAFEHQRR